MFYIIFNSNEKMFIFRLRFTENNYPFNQSANENPIFIYYYCFTFYIIILQ